MLLALDELCRLDRSEMTAPKDVSRAELSQKKLAAVRAMLDSRANEGDIKRAFAMKFQCSPRSAEPFIRKAKAQIREESGKSKEEHKADAYAFLTSVVANTNNSVRDRVNAQKELNRITGVAAPITFAPTDTEGRDIPPVGAMTIESAQAIIAAFKQGAEPPGGQQ